jgi:hypothetical protein
MDWKGWSLVLGLGMLVLAVIGLIVHSDLRLVGADIIGALAAIALILVLRGGQMASVGIPILGSVTLIVMAILAMTSHGSPVLISLTLAFAFAFAFLSWTRISAAHRAGSAGRPPRTA